MLDFVGRKCWYQLLIVSVPGYANFFYKMTKKIVGSYHVCIYICWLIGRFFNFHWKTDMCAVWVDVIVVCKHDLKIKLFHVLVGAMRNLFLVSRSLSIPWNTISSTPGMYLATSPSHFPVFLSSLIFFFLLFLYFSFTFYLFCQWQKTLLLCQMEKQLHLGGFHLLFLFASLLSSGIFFFFFCFVLVSVVAFIVFLFLVLQFLL